MFSRRHEQELLEIKALTADLGERFQEILERLERIRETQDQLATQDSPAADNGAGSAATDAEPDEAAADEAAPRRKGDRKIKRARQEGGVPKARERKRERKRAAAKSAEGTEGRPRKKRKAVPAEGAGPDEE